MIKFWKPQRLAVAAEKPYAKALIEQVAEAAKKLAEVPTPEAAQHFMERLTALTHTAQGEVFA